MEPELNDLIKQLHISQKKKDVKNEIKSLIEIVKYHYKTKDYKKAKFTCKQILEKNSKIEGINYYLALIEIQNDNLLGAKKYLKLELKINKKNYFAKELLEKLEINYNFPIITLILFFLNILVFYFIYPQIDLINLIKFTISSNSFDIITAITSIFFHMNLIHLVVNMVFLLMFGLILEKLIGSFKFLTLYLISGIVGNLVQAYFVPQGFVFGASGAIFGIVGGIIMKDPLLKLKIFGLFKSSIILIFGGFFILSAFISNYIVLNNFSTGNISHIIGFLLGIFFIGIFYQKTIFVFYNWLFIALGFIFINFSLTLILTDIINFKNILISITFLLIGLFLIIYSYYKLKLQIKLEEKLK